MSTNFQRLPLLSIPISAAGALAAGTFVTQAGQNASAGGDAAGILQQPTSNPGDMATATVFGIDTLLISATVAQDQLLASDANGQGTPVGLGSTATATAVQSSGTITTPPTITSGGSGYTTPPTVTFSGGGASTQATGTAVLNAAGQVASITLNTAGVGYTSNPTVTIAAPTGQTKPLARALMAGGAGDFIPVIKLAN